MIYLKRLWSVVAVLFALALPLVVLATSSEMTHNTVPSSSSSFLTDLQNFLKEEEAKRYQDAWDGGFIVSGGLHSTGAGLVGAPGATTGYAGGYYFSETASITYTNNTTCFVIAHKDITGNLSSFTRVAGSHYLTACGSAAQPTLPADSTWLMLTVTSGGSITAVTDLRSRSPDLDTYLLASLPTAGRRGRMAFVRDTASGIPYWDNGTSWQASATNPLTTLGDIIVAGASGTPTRFAIGTSNQLLGVNSPANALEYKTLAVSGGLSIANASNSITVSALNASAGLNNIGLSATVAGNVLTIALKDGNGSDPSASSPGTILFRHTTQATGQYLAATVSAALSTSVSAGSSLGFGTSESGRVYVGAQYNSGTVELCEWNSLTSAASVSQSGMFKPNEALLQSTTAEGGAGSADSGGVIYCTTGRASQPFRILGWIDIATGNPAGNWSNSPTVVQVMGLGIPKTGDIIQVVGNTTGAMATGTTVFPFDDSIPLITEGNEFMTQSITPTSAVNRLVIQHQGAYARSVAGRVGLAVFQDTTASALVASFGGQNSTNDLPTLGMIAHEMAAGTTSSTTIRIRAGDNSAGTTTFNGAVGARIYGGVMNSYLRVTEIFRHENYVPDGWEQHIPGVFMIQREPEPRTRWQP